MKTSNRYILLLTILSVLCLAVLAFGQEKPKEYKPTEIQLLKLQNKQKDAVIAKQQRDALQEALHTADEHFQNALKALNDEAEKVKTEQGWPKELQFSPNDLSYTEPPKEQKKP